MLHGQPITIGGGSGVGEMPITENGIYNVTNYASVNVNISPVLLWENANKWHASFSPGDVSVDGAGYGSYLLEVAETADRADAGYVDSVFVLKKSDEGQWVCTGYNYIRYIESVSDSVVDFGNSYVFDTSIPGMMDIDYTVCIPLRIWGVKFSL